MDRNHMKKHCIQSMFVYMIRCAKKGHNNNAKGYSENLFGMLLYMRAVDDITEKEYNRINDLRYLILEKYNIH